MKKLLLIINSVAGKLAAHSALYDIISVFCSNGYTVTVKITQYRGHATEMAASAAEEGYDMVVCCGGDGTLNEVISGMVSKDGKAALPLGYIPAGSTNDFADTLGIPSDINTACRNITKENIQPIDIGKFGEHRYFSYIATFGAFSSASYDAPQDLKNTLGHFAYILQGIKDLSKIEATQATVIADGVEYSGNYIFASVSNTKSVAGIVKLKDEIVNLQDGLFEVLLVKNPKDLIELGNIVNGILSSNFSSDSFTFIKAKEIQFRLTKRVDWSLDGEKANGGSEILIKNLHEAVQLCR